MKSRPLPKKTDGFVNQTGLTFVFGRFTVNEDQVRGSDVGPVVYFRNCTGDPFVSYKEMAERWGVSKSTVGRILGKLAEQDYLTLVPCAGRRGSVIYLNNYLSTMFDISDVMIDKEEVAMALDIKIRVDDEKDEQIPVIAEEQICVSTEIPSVPKPHIVRIMQKLAETLAAFGIPCGGCPHSRYKLYAYLGCTGKILSEVLVYEIDVGCSLRETSYRFEAKITVIEDSGGAG